jgi:hypothetical protein
LPCRCRSSSWNWHTQKGMRYWSLNFQSIGNGLHPSASYWI